MRLVIWDAIALVMTSLWLSSPKMFSWGWKFRQDSFLFLVSLIIQNTTNFLLFVEFVISDTTLYIKIIFAHFGSWVALKTTYWNFWQYSFPAEVSTTFVKCLDLCWKYISWYQRSYDYTRWYIMKIKKKPRIPQIILWNKKIVTGIVWKTLFLSENSARPKSHGKELPLVGPLNARQMIIRTINACLPHSLWRHQMEIFSVWLAFCAGNSPVTGEFPTQWQVTRSFDVFFDLRLNKPLSKQWWGWWFETPSRSLWRHCNVTGKHKHHWALFWPAIHKHYSHTNVLECNMHTPLGLLFPRQVVGRIWSMCCIQHINLN